MADRPSLTGTIEGIDGVHWPDPGPDATALIRRCVALRRKPLSQFTTEDLRIMIGQQIAVPILLPMAVTVLVDNPLADGGYYPGDLLYAVLRLPERAWHHAGRDRHHLGEVLRATPLPNEGINAELRHAIGVFASSSLGRPGSASSGA